MAFRWRAEDGPTLNAGLVTSSFFNDSSGPVLLIKPIFLRFFLGGWGVGRGSGLPVSPLDPRIRDNIHIFQCDNPINVIILVSDQHHHQISIQCLQLYGVNK